MSICRVGYGASSNHERRDRGISLHREIAPKKELRRKRNNGYRSKNAHASLNDASFRFPQFAGNGDSCTGAEGNGLQDLSFQPAVWNRRQ
jgi:hypothetical protein